MAPPPSPPRRVVHLDGHVLLKIIKHCQEAMPAVVTGVLLGLDAHDKLLEVTSCFPALSEGDDAADDAYQLDMLKCLRTVNVDCYTVGWYQSTYLSSFLNESTIDVQFTHQENLDKRVCITYDPLLSTQGNLCLKAIRLTDSFMAIYREHKHKHTPLRLSSLKSYEVYEEIPIQVRNSSLIQGALHQLTSQASPSPLAASKFGLMDFPSNQFLEKNMEFMSECIDDLVIEHGKQQYYQRNVARQRAQQEAILSRQGNPSSEELARNPLFRPIPEPSRLASLLASNQITNHSKQLNEFAGESLGKVFMAKALQNEEQ